MTCSTPNHQVIERTDDRQQTTSRQAGKQASKQAGDTTHLDHHLQVLAHVLAEHLLHHVDRRLPREGAEVAHDELRVHRRGIGHEPFDVGGGAVGRDFIMRCFSCHDDEKT